ncbi:MAG: ABC transporter permease [Bacteroidaceae bacterium]|nr:ABC transporter permease [Bacteroidaceae bacterium]
MKSNTLTIIKKEFARFFGDRQLLFTTVIMPGLLIYLVYSLMGNGINKMVTEGANEVVTLQVENMPASLAPVLYTLDSNLSVTMQPFSDADIKQLEDKDINAVLLRFPYDFDAIVATGINSVVSPASLSSKLQTPTSELPNVEIYYNSTNNASSRVYMIVSTMLGNYGRPFTVNVPQNDEQRFDQATDESIGAMVWSKILPMLIIMMLFSGVMAIAPSAIAGEKERGTIATLLVTPMRRNELALGKIVSLSCIALLSGISSFIGIALALPKMVPLSEGGLAFHYATSDYLVLLLVIFASVLIMASAISLLSALAKDVKNAGTMIVPFMLVVMLAGLLPMFQNGAAVSLVYYLIPFYNSIEVMTAVFAHEMTWMPVIVTLCADVVYTGIAVWGLTRMFNSEKIMFSR